MKKYDLHIHSKFSDGEYSLEEIIDKLKKYNIEIFSITDHDNIESIKEMKKVDTKGLTYITGVEFSAQKGMYEMHILGYGIDGSNIELIKTCQDIKMRKKIRNLEVIQQLKEKFGIEITREETLELFKKQGFVGQTTIARLLVKKGIIPTIEYYFKNYFNNIKLKTPATIDLNKAVNIIHNAGGYAILAHPITLEKRYNIDISEVFYIFKDAGIDGIEVFNSKHSFNDIRRYYKLAKENRLMISGGSDYHGEIMKPNIKLGKISKDGNEKMKHYDMTIISKVLCKQNKKEEINNNIKEREI